MAATTCSKCGYEMPDQVWGCPRCGSSTGEGSEESDESGEGIPAKGMMVLLSLVIFFPVLLFLIHILVPGM